MHLKVGNKTSLHNFFYLIIILDSLNPTLFYNRLKKHLKVALVLGHHLMVETQLKSLILYCK